MTAQIPDHITTRSRRIIVGQRSELEKHLSIVRLIIRLLLCLLSSPWKPFWCRSLFIHSVILYYTVTINERTRNRRFYIVITSQFYRRSLWPIYNILFLTITLSITLTSGNIYQWQQYILLQDTLVHESYNKNRITHNHFVLSSCDITIHVYIAISSLRQDFRILNCAIRSTRIVCGVYVSARHTYTIYIQINIIHTNFKYTIDLHVRKYKFNCFVICIFIDAYYRQIVLWCKYVIWM